MRLIVPTLLAAVAASLLATAAEAQSRRPLRFTVVPRSYLDAGKVVPVGSLQEYARVDRFSPVSTSPQFVFSEGILPPRIGGGRSAFGEIGF
ncbi:hypothetical protein [Terrarubrum flagellatum]|uniref:hypothetical protein n=1 Tax=Terrirubrum flagellatum TaxID=2895980 RepID=UPI003145067E